MENIYLLLNYLEYLTNIKTESKICGKLESMINSSIILVCEELNNCFGLARQSKNSSEEIMEKLKEYIPKTIQTN